MTAAQDIQAVIAGDRQQPRSSALGAGTRLQAADRLDKDLVGRVRGILRAAEQAAAEGKDAREILPIQVPKHLALVIRQ